ncbi:hypothetical protein ACKC9G_14800 [Pokkaliibacter sp. CJK22405]|uniref:hypothetical protein n=1 Tax=Pokkaliibacter sp. CJK22405 TaxID=3384615 RepID=UPI0039852DC9
MTFGDFMRVLMLLLMGVLGFMLGGSDGPDAEYVRLDHERFNQGVWRISVSSRPYMLVDLVKEYRLVGMDRSALISLLGEPDSYHQSSNISPAYHLNTERVCDVVLPLDHLTGKVDKVQISPQGCI